MSADNPMGYNGLPEITMLRTYQKLPTARTRLGLPTRSERHPDNAAAPTTAPPHAQPPTSCTLVRCTLLRPILPRSAPAAAAHRRSTAAETVRQRPHR